MTHMITISGAEYHLAGPRSLALGARPVALNDIAHHLSLINRFHGATTRPYSVAEHSLLCSEIAKREGGPVFLQLAALMHDAHEAYTSDLSSPAKVAVDNYSMGAAGIQAWGLFEDEHAYAVRRHFHLLTAFSAHRAAIKRIDLMALATERRDLTAYRPVANGPWAILGDNTREAVRPVDWVNLASAEREALPWRHWREAFIERYFALKAEAERLPLVSAAGMTA